MSVEKYRNGIPFSIKDFFKETQFPYSVPYTQRMFRELIKLGALEDTTYSPKDYVLTPKGQEQAQNTFNQLNYYDHRKKQQSA